MRTLVGTTPTVLARRGIGLERLAQVVLRQDAYAEPPGPTLTLAIGERTAYRPAAWVLDEFARPALGTGYVPWGGTAGLMLDAETVVPTAVGPVEMATHSQLGPRDQWAAVEIAALSGPSATVGVLLRAGVDDAYRITATSAGQTVLERLEAGTPIGLAAVPTPWRAGDTLRAEVVWNRLVVYRDQIRVLEAMLVAPGTVGATLTWDWVALHWDDAGVVWEGVGPSGLTGRGLGLVAGRAVAGDAAALGAWVAGAARQEYLGAGLDLGDVQMVLGEPVRFDVTVSNLAPMGGADRFAALLRHGTNTAGTYDLDRGTVRILTAIQGATAPLTAAVGWIDAPGELTEDHVRLAVRGRDAFLTPRLTPGSVAYLPGPDPDGLLPLPADPCAAAVPPAVTPGAVPADPLPVPPIEGLGPEAPADGGAGVLLGGYTIVLGYRQGVGDEEPPWVTTNTVIPLPDTAFAFDPDVCPATERDFIGATAASFLRFEHVYRPHAPAGQVERTMHLYYFGPDIAGDALALVPAPLTLQPCFGPPGTPVRVAGNTEAAALSGFTIPTGVNVSVHGRLARFNASAVHTLADLQALRLATPPEVPAGDVGYEAHLPARLETLADFTTTHVSGGSTSVAERTPIGATVPVTVTQGPCLLGVEFIAATDLAGYGADYQYRVGVRGEYHDEVVETFDAGAPCLRGTA